VDYPISVNDDGIKIKPEFMNSEQLYHCIFQNKVLLVYKDFQDFLNCYEIEEEEIVNKIKSNPDNDEIEKILEDFIKDNQMKK
jgi:hypothetical protein